MNHDKLYDESIILIGPSGAGKSETARALQQITGMPRICMDRIANRDRNSGFKKKFKDGEHYNAFLIESLIRKAEEDGIPGIVDFGAGHSIYHNPQLFQEVKRNMRKFKNVILILPSKDKEESLKIMKERSTGDTSDNKEFIESPCNHQLATMEVYGDGRTPNEIAKEILDMIDIRRQMEKESKEKEEKRAE